MTTMGLLATAAESRPGENPNRGADAAGSGRRAKLLVVTGVFPPDSGGPASYVPLYAQYAAALAMIWLASLAFEAGTNSGLTPILESSPRSLPRGAESAWAPEDVAEETTSCAASTAD